MKNKFFSILVIILSLSGCAANEPVKEEIQTVDNETTSAEAISDEILIDNADLQDILTEDNLKSDENPIKTTNERIIYDISETENKFTSKSFIWFFEGDIADLPVSVEYKTLTPGKALITDAFIADNKVNFTPAVGQGGGIASVTIHVGEYQKTVFIKLYDLSLRLVALDFDDGPSEYTEQILDTLNNAGANATFYVVGKLFHDITGVYTGAEIYSEILKKEAALGNQIGNHTYNHPWEYAKDGVFPDEQAKGWMEYTEQEVIEQITRLDDLLYNLIGLTTRYYSTPYGRASYYPNDRIFSIYGNIVHSNDWQSQTTKEQIFEKILSAPNGSIVIMHDVYQKTADALKEALASPRADEIQFVTFNELDEIFSWRENRNDGN